MTFQTCPYCKKGYSILNQKPTHVVKEGEGCRIITINIPVKELKMIEILRDYFEIPSRSEFVRRAVSAYIDSLIAIQQPRKDLVEKYNSRVIRVMY